MGQCEMQEAGLDGALATSRAKKEKLCGQIHGTFTVPSSVMLKWAAANSHISAEKRKMETVSWQGGKPASKETGETQDPKSSVTPSSIDGPINIAWRHLNSPDGEQFHLGKARRLRSSFNAAIMFLQTQKMYFCLESKAGMKG